MFYNKRQTLDGNITHTKQNFDLIQCYLDFSLDKRVIGYSDRHCTQTQFYDIYRINLDQ